jgi:hypothetical protein
MNIFSLSPNEPKSDIQPTEPAPSYAESTRTKIPPGATQQDSTGIFWDAAGRHWVMPEAYHEWASPYWEFPKDAAPPAAEPQTDAEIEAECEALMCQNELAQARVARRSWSPLDDIREEKAKQDARIACWRRHVDDAPTEASLIENNIWHFPPPEISYWFHTLPLEALGVPEGSEEFGFIQYGASWKCKTWNPAGNAFLVDYSDLGWPTSAGPSNRFVMPHEDRRIRSILANAGFSIPGAPDLIKCIDLYDLVREDLPEPKYLIDDLLREAGAAMVYGTAGVGKSWFVHTLALMIANGNFSILDGALKASQPGCNVLLVDGEMTMLDIQRRTIQLETAMGIEPPRGRFKAYFKTLTPLGCNFIDLSNHEDKLRILNEVRRLDIKLLILDNISTLSPGLKDENAAAEWNALTDIIIGCKGMGCAVIFLHHTGKNGSYRGSSHLMAAIERSIKLDASTEDAVKFRGVKFVIEAGKDRNGDDLQIDRKTLQLAKPNITVEDLALDLPPGQTFRPEGWRIFSEETAKAYEVVNYLKTGKYANQQAIADAMGIDRSTVSRNLARASALHIISERDIKAFYKVAKAGDPSFDDLAAEAKNETAKEIVAALKDAGIDAIAKGDSFYDTAAGQKYNKDKKPPKLKAGSDPFSAYAAKLNPGTPS